MAEISHTNNSARVETPAAQQDELIDRGYSALELGNNIHVAAQLACIRRQREFSSTDPHGDNAFTCHMEAVNAISEHGVSTTFSCKNCPGLWAVVVAGANLKEQIDRRAQERS